MDLETIKKQFPPYSGKIGSNFKDNSGETVGHLKILYRGENNPLDSRPRTRYVCKCDCGNVVIKRKEDIFKNPTIASCGRCLEYTFSQLKELNNFYILNTYRDKNDFDRWHCEIKCKTCGAIFYPRRSDLYNNLDYSCSKCNKNQNFFVGDIIGDLTIIKKQVDEKNHLYYLCQCSCGEILWLPGYRLNNRRTCGNHRDPTDIVGQKFGKLQVINSTEEFHGGQRMYNCLCDCGTEVLVGRSNLITGHTQSCGCMRSKGEEKISSLLNQNNIYFEKNKTFEDFYRDNPCGKLKFDFYLPDLNCAIEYDGMQHFKEHREYSGWYNPEQYELIHQRDIFKNQYCWEHNIILIRIPYWVFDQLEIIDLNPETSQYIFTLENQDQYYN